MIIKRIGRFFAGETSMNGMPGTRGEVIGAWIFLIIFVVGIAWALGKGCEYWGNC